MKNLYKGHTIEISECGDEEVSKAWHEVTLPDGSRRLADITPYDWTYQTVRLWIDAGYPKRNGVGPLHRDEIEKMLVPPTIARGDAGTPNWKQGGSGLAVRWINLDGDHKETGLPMIGIEMVFPCSVDGDLADHTTAYIIDAINEKYQRDLLNRGAT